MEQPKLLLVSSSNLIAMQQAIRDAEKARNYAQQWLQQWFASR